MKFLPIRFVSTVLPLAALAVAITAAAPSARAQSEKPFLHPLFTDNAVLQRDRVIPVWGWTTPGQSVTVQMDTKTTTAKADATGKWMTRIGPYKAGDGAHILRVSDANPADTVTRSNILFGDVWLCSGQSNMEMGIANVNDADKEIAAANYPNIRLFTVPKRVSLAPMQGVNGKWLVCNPTNIKEGAWGGFSAVGYFFGRKLNQELKVPIGLIHSSWGGTIAEAWVSEASLGALPDFQSAIAGAKAARSSTSSAPLDARINTFLASYDKTLQTNWADLSAGDANWKTINLPGNWENAGIPELAEFDGVALFRREVNVPAEWASKPLTLSLGAIDDNDVTYWNGVRVGATTGWMDGRTYTIPASQVKAGRNVIAVRVTDTGVGGGFHGNKSDMVLKGEGGSPIALDGAWKYRIGVPLDKMGAMPRELNPNEPNQVDVLYNGMIAPLEPFALKGAIWYQGESNAGRDEQYGRLLPTLIGDWRKQFSSPLDFYIVQLAGFMAPDDAPKNEAWPNLRAAQMRTAQTVPNTGIAITTDIGDEKDIHPKNKQDVGLRLALSALAKTYKRPVEYSGPTVKSVTPNGESVVVTFDNANGGLTLKGDASRVFAVAGADQNFFWATPRVEGNKVVLTSSVVARPMYVRYGWSNLPRATLYNGANLPAPPFESIK